MHDSLVVAFEIRRPWPSRSSTPAGQATRWKVSGAFWTLAGRRYFFPSLVTVWHREPGGADSGEVCKRHVRTRDPITGEWSVRMLGGWRWHVHHWKVQVRPLQHARRRLLTRCSWCGGRSVKGDPVNISHQWDGPRGRWWQGEPGLFHLDCSSVRTAHQKCLCADPLLRHGDYGQCAFCGLFRSYGGVPDEADRLLAALPPGSRIPASLRQQLNDAWDLRRARNSGSP